MNFLTTPPASTIINLQDFPRINNPIPSSDQTIRLLAIISATAPDQLSFANIESLKWFIEILRTVKHSEFTRRYLCDETPFTREDDRALPGATIKADVTGKLFWSYLPARQANKSERLDYILHPMMADVISNLAAALHYDLKRASRDAAGLAYLHELSILSMLLFEISALNDNRQRDFASRIDGNRTLWDGYDIIVTQAALNYGIRIRSY